MLLLQITLADFHPKIYRLVHRSQHPCPTQSIVSTLQWISTVNHVPTRRSNLALCAKLVLAIHLNPRALKASGIQATVETALIVHPFAVNPADLAFDERTAEARTWPRRVPEPDTRGILA